MLSFIFVLLIFWLSVVSSKNAGEPYDCSYCQPEQIHISFGDKPNDIVVTWSTINDTRDSIAEYGEGVLAEQAAGTSWLFTDGGNEKRTQWVHKVTLSNLKFNTRYVYHVGSTYGWSEELSFKTSEEGQDWAVSAAIYGDMGTKNAHSLSYLQEETERDHFNLILHVGDFAYDMDTDNGRVGDEFMRQIQPIAARIPYMTCPGNHEQAYNFSNYANRFSMPGRDSSLFYSFDVGPVHFVSISTEVYYFTQYGLKLIANQYEWLKEDLATANEKENRSKRPWIILFGHRPMYCTSPLDPDCGDELTRIGIFGAFGLEPLLNEFGVDIVFWGHEHSYERMWPLYNYKIYNGSHNNPYVNPRAPVHVITGSAGCDEQTNGFNPNPPDWSAFRSADYGYTRFKAYNKTHVYLEQVSVDLKGEVIDSFWIIKDKHAAFNL